MAVVTEITEFIGGGEQVEFLVLSEEDEATGDLIGFQFENNTAWTAQFSVIRSNRRVWRDRVRIPVGSSRLKVPANIKLDDIDYWTSLPRKSWQ